MPARAGTARPRTSSRGRSSPEPSISGSPPGSPTKTSVFASRRPNRSASRWWWARRCGRCWRSPMPCTAPSRTSPRCAESWSPGREWKCAADANAHIAAREKRGEQLSGAQFLENFLQALSAGMLTGTIYGLMCVGLSLIFGVMRVINFAHGDFMMLGMYVAYYAFGLLGAQRMFGDAVGPYVAVLLAGPAIFLAGMIVHRALVGRVSGIRGAALESEGHYAQLILTLGIALVLQNGGLFLFGSAPVSIPTRLSSSAWPVRPLRDEDVQ